MDPSTILPCPLLSDDQKRIALIVTEMIKRQAATIFCFDICEELKHVYTLSESSSLQPYFSGYARDFSRSCIDIDFDSVMVKCIRSIGWAYNNESNMIGLRLQQQSTSSETHSDSDADTDASTDEDDIDDKVADVALSTVIKKPVKQLLPSDDASVTDKKCIKLINTLKPSKKRSTLVTSGSLLIQMETSSKCDDVGKFVIWNANTALMKHTPLHRLCGAGSISPIHTARPSWSEIQEIFTSDHPYHVYIKLEPHEIVRFDIRTGERDPMVSSHKLFGKEEGSSLGIPLFRSRLESSPDQWLTPVTDMKSHLFDDDDDVQLVRLDCFYATDSWTSNREAKRTDPQSLVVLTSRIRAIIGSLYFVEHDKKPIYATTDWMTTSKLAAWSAEGTWITYFTYFPIRLEEKQIMRNRFITWSNICLDNDEDLMRITCWQVESTTVSSVWSQDLSEMAAWSATCYGSVDRPMLAMLGYWFEKKTSVVPSVVPVRSPLQAVYLIDIHNGLRISTIPILPLPSLPSIMKPISIFPGKPKRINTHGALLDTIRIIRLTHDEAYTLAAWLTVALHPLFPPELIALIGTTIW